MSGGVENCGWYVDSYHHWQIAYFTLKVGIYSGPRLWDLGGMEYFWGVLPPLVQAGLMVMLGTASIVPYRVANSFFGSASIILLYALGKRYFNGNVAPATALICAVNPVLIVADASGMEEPLAIMLLLLGMWYYERSEFKCGVLLALASMCRAEFWLMAMGLLALYLVFERSGKRFFPALSGWLLAMLPYVWHLWGHTGNPVYPIYWNFFGSAVGQWLAKVSLTSHQTLVKYAFMIAFSVSTGSLILLVRKKPRAYPVYSLFLGYSIFISFMLGFTAYTACYVDRFLVDRIFSLDYMFIALLVSVVIFHYLKTKTPRFSRLHLDKATLASLLLALLVLWLPIMHYNTAYGKALQDSEALATFVAAKYEGGTVLVPGSEPMFTYFLVKHGIGAPHILSEKYHPEDPADCMWWLQTENVSMAVIPEEEAFYQSLAKQFNTSFISINNTINFTFLVYRVVFA